MGPRMSVFWSGLDCSKAAYLLEFTVDIYKLYIFFWQKIYIIFINQMGLSRACIASSVFLKRNGIRLLERIRRCTGLAA